MFRQTFQQEQEKMRACFLTFLVALAFSLLPTQPLHAGDEAKFDKWLEDLNSRSKSIRRQSAEQLSRYAGNEEVVMHELLRHAETHPDSAVRGMALEATLFARERDYTKLYRRVLENDKAVFPRVIAASGLARSGNKEFCNVFLEGLKDKSQYVQLRAVSGMVYGIPAGGEEKLIEIVKNRAPIHLIIPAIDALGANKVTGADEVIIALADSLEADSSLHVPCISALSRIGTKSAAEYIMKRANRLADDRWGWAVISALGHLKEYPEAMKFLIRLVKYSADDKVRLIALNALSDAGTPEALDAIIEATFSDWQYGFRYGIPAICKFEGEKATKALLRAASKTEDNGARLTALKELVKRKENKAIELSFKILSDMRDSGYVGSVEAAVDAAVAFNEPAAIRHILDAVAPSINRAEIDAVLKALRKFKKEVTILYYLEWVRKESKCSDFKDCVCKELIYLGVPGLAELFGEQLVKEPDFRMRGDYAEHLGKLGDKAALPYLLDAFSREDTCNVLDMLLEAFGELKARESVEPIIDGLKTHWHTHYQANAYIALGKIGTEEAMAAVYKGFESVDDREVKSAIIVAIAMWGDREHVHNLLDLLKDTNDTHTVETIVGGFLRLKDKSIEPYLLESAAGKHAALSRNKALLCLAKISGNPEEYLRARLSDPDKEMRSNAASLLLDLKDSQSLPAIRKMLEDPDATLAGDVASMLAYHGDGGSALAIRRVIERYPAGERRYYIRERLMELEMKLAKE